MGLGISSRNQQPDHPPGHARYAGRGVKMAAESDRSWESEAERNVRPWWSQIFRCLAAKRRVLRGTVFHLFRGEYYFSTYLLCLA